MSAALDDARKSLDEAALTSTGGVRAQHLVARAQASALTSIAESLAVIAQELLKDDGG